MSEPPQTLHDGRISLTRRLGEGGMAIVYEAYDHDLTVWRAVKFLRPELADKKAVRRRFLGEAQALAKLDHPHIVRVYDVGEEDGWPFILMSLTRGGSLEDFLCREERMGPHQSTQTMIQVCSGVQAAHDAGIVHRDLKPDNVLITTRGVCKVTDFGIAIVDENLRRTRTGSVMGTLGYMAPEQQRDAKNLDATADVYALGATLYALVTGEQPADLHMVALEEDLLEHVPEPLKPIITTATAYRPTERYPTVAALQKALEACLPQLVPENEPPALARPARQAQPPPRTSPPSPEATAERPITDASETRPPDEDLPGSAPATPGPLPYQMRKGPYPPTDPDGYIDHEADEKARRKREALEKLAAIERKRNSLPPHMPETQPAQSDEAALPEVETADDVATVPPARTAKSGLDPEDVAEAAQEAAQWTLQLLLKAVKPFWPGLIALALFITIFTGLLISGAYTVRSAASEAHAAQVAFLKSLSDERELVDDLKAMGIRDDTLPVMQMQLEETKAPKKRIALGADLIQVGRLEHEKARFTTPAHLQHRVDSAKEHLEKLEKSQQMLERKQDAWEEAATTGLGAIAVAFGAAPTPE